MGLPEGAGNAQIVVNASATKYKVPPNLLWGVFGVETGFGKNIATSSAGAMGAFQFIPSTAKHYNYPLTNNPNVSEFQRQSDAAAHYLSDLHKQLGNWDDAIAAYNAGPGNYKIPAAQKYLAAVKAAAGHKVQAGGVVGAVGGAGNAVAGAENSVVPPVFDGLKAIGAFFLALLQADTWLRILKVVGGGILLLIGVTYLSGNSPTNIAKVAAIA